MKNKVLIILILLNIFITISGIVGLFKIEEDNISLLFILNGILLIIYSVLRQNAKGIK
jgi:hypothetical protein